MKILILITTYKRPEMLKRLLSHIDAQETDHEVTVKVFEDPRGGKANYQHLINEVFEFVKSAGEFDYYIQLPDDVELSHGFVNITVSAFDAVNTTINTGCLSIMLDEGRIGKPCWTKFQPEIINHFAYKIHKTQWVDMIYICKRQFFEAINYKIDPIHPERWQRDPLLSSGVGEQISKRLHGRGVDMYHLISSIAQHGDHESVMNTEERRRTPLTSGTIDPIIAGMASINGRAKSLEDAVESVLPYVDRLVVTLNSYDHVPEFLKHPKIEVHQMDNELGDAAKFIGVPYYPAFFLSIDDDIIYPKDYVWNLVNAIRDKRKEGKRVVIGVHGKVMKTRPIASFYRGHKSMYHCKDALNDDKTCDMLGTGTTAWHTADFQIRVEDFKHRNMADVIVALQAKRQGVEMIAIKRPNGWIKLSEKINHHKDTIYAHNSSNVAYDKIITDIYNGGKEKNTV